MLGSYFKICFILLGGIFLPQVVAGGADRYQHPLPKLPAVWGPGGGEVCCSLALLSLFPLVPHLCVPCSPSRAAPRAHRPPPSSPKSPRGPDLGCEPHRQPGVIRARRSKTQRWASAAARETSPDHLLLMALGFNDVNLF